MKNYPNIRAINIKKEVDLSNPTQHLSSISDKYWVDQIGDYTGEQYDKSIYTFNGSNSYIDTNQVAVSLVGEVSIYARVVSSGCLISNRTSSSNYFEVNLGSIGSPLVQVTLKESPNNYVLNSSTINTGDWHKIVVRYTGVKLFIYIDDVLDSTLSGLTNITSNSNNVLIGTNNNNGHVLEGEVADFTWKDLQGNILIHYKMEERSGNIAYNSAGTGVHGTLYNITHTPIRDPFLFNYTNEEGYNEDNGVILPKVEGFVKVEDYPWNWYTQGGNLLYKDNYYKPSSDGTLLQGDQTDYDNITTFDISNGSYTLDLTSTLLGKFQNLNSLIVEGNPINLIDTSLNINLSELIANSTDLFSINIDLNVNLQTLELDNNNINSLDISNNINLNNLSINFTPISVINISNNTSLSKLHSHNTQISFLDISNNPLLDDIKVNDSNLDAEVNNQLLITLDLFNKSNGFLESTIYGTGYLSLEAIDSYNSLVSKNWTIVGFNVNLDPGTVYDIKDFPLNWINGEYYLNYKDNTFEVSSSIPILGKSEYDSISNISLTNQSLNTNFSSTLLEKFSNLNTLNLANNNISLLDLSKSSNLLSVETFNNSLTNSDVSRIYTDLDKHNLTDGYLKVNTSNNQPIDLIGQLAYQNLIDKDWNVETQGLLNAYSGAAAAYSMNLLDDNYTGPCVNVRRSSDNATLDIGFRGIDLDTTTLENFCKPNTVVTVDMNTDSDNDGLLDDFTLTSGRGVPSLITGNGHIGQAQRLDGDATGLAGINFLNLPTIIGQEITISFMYRSNRVFGLTNSSAITQFPQTVVNTGNAIRYEETAVWDPASGPDNRIAFSWLYNTSEWYEISDLSVTIHTADGYVTVWYDQSGNNYNATQTTSSAQPKIVSGGSVILENSRPAVSFDGVDDTLQYDFSPDEVQPFTLFYVRRYRNVSSTCVGIGVDSTANTGYAEIANGIQFRTYYGNYLVNGSSNTNQGLWYTLGNGANSEIGLDSNTAITGNAGTGGLEVLSIGSAGGSAFFAPINTQSVIIYNSDQSVNRTAIEKNINSYYNIYSTQTGNKLLNYYPNAAVSYSLRKEDSNYTGAAVNVRRASDNTTLDIGFAGNDLDIASLETFCNPNFLVDVDMDTDTNGNGMLDVFLRISNRGTPSLVTGNGHIGQAQRLDGDATGLAGIYSDIFPPMIGQEITISFMYRSNVNITLTNGASTTQFPLAPANTGNAIRYEETRVWNPTSGADGRLTFSWLNGVNDWYEISDLSVTVHTADGYVTTWYDQSGNGYDATQTISSSQPKIVEQGVVLLENNKPAIVSDGVDDYLQSGIISFTNPVTMFMVNRKISGVNTVTGLNNIASITGGFYSQSTGYVYYQQGPQVSPNFGDNNQNLLYAKTSTIGTDWEAGANSILATNTGENVGTATPNQITISARSNGTLPMNAATQTFIVYNSDQSANRIGIEYLLNEYYNIFPFENLILSPYIQRVQSDGGIVESQNYLLQILSDLYVITIGDYIERIEIDNGIVEAQDYLLQLFITLNQ